MNLSQIKQFVKQNGDKFIFMENEEPEMVVMSFHEYEKIVARANGNGRYEKTPEANSPYSPNRISPLEEMKKNNPPQEPTAPRNYFHSHAIGHDMPRESVFEEETRVMIEGDESFSSEPKIGLASGRAPLRLEDIAVEDLPI